ncbi:MAG TPA: LLM class flavin-dependent oxidoreductase [Chloroflexota bacterium]
MRFGTALGVEPAALERVEALEAAGFESIWFADFQLVGGDPYVFCALAAQRTRSLRVGVGVSNPRVRHLTVLANLAATLEVLFPGRAIVGLGTGFSPLRALRRNWSSSSSTCAS